MEDVFLKPQIVPCPLKQRCHFCAWVGESNDSPHSDTHKATRKAFIDFYYDGLFEEETRLLACSICRFYLRSPRDYLTWHDGDMLLVNELDLPQAPMRENLGVATEAHVLSCHEDGVDSVVDL